MKNNPHPPNFFLKPKPGTCNQEKQQFVLEILYVYWNCSKDSLLKLVKLGVIL